MPLMNKSVDDIRAYLLAESDEKYRIFQSRLMPTVDKERIIGVRSPILRKYAKELLSEGGYADFLASLPHKYYEEDNLHAFLIEGIEDFEECISALDRFLPYVDNWATCDSMRPKVLNENPTMLRRAADRWIESGDEYTVRYGIEVYMTYFLDGHFEPDILSHIASIKSEHYYVKMMVAWFFATALAKQYDAALPYLEGRALDRWTHNKTVRKAIESYRISDEKKAHLRTLTEK